MCKYCNSESNIVHSGVDAFVLGCETGTTCYDCANANRIQTA